MQNESFGKIEKDINERVDHIEQTLPHLARLNEQLAFLDKVNKLESEVLSFFDAQVSVKNKLEDIGDVVESIKKNHVFDQSFLANLITDAKAKTESNSAKIEQFNAFWRKEMMSLNDHKDALYAKLDDVKAAIDTHPSIAKASLAVSGLSLDVEGVKVGLESNSKKLDLLSENIAKSSKAISACQQNRESDKSEIDALKSLVEQLRADLEKSKLELRSFSVNSIDQFRSEVNNKFAALPMPEKVPLDEVKDEFDRKLQPVTFDAKNANIRSSNNETKILLLEKKVEQLFLLKSQSDLNK